MQYRAYTHDDHQILNISNNGHLQVGFLNLICIIFTNSDFIDKVCIVCAITIEKNLIYIRQILYES